MALEASFSDLVAHLKTLQEILAALRTTIVEDRPMRGDVVLVDSLGEAADDLLGWLEESLRAAVEGCQAVGRPMDIDRARRALTACQEHCNHIAQRFYSDPASYERMDEIVRLGRARGGEWRAWAMSVKEALDRCRQPLNDVNQTLFRCWQEVAERVGLTSVSVQATNIGQQVTLPVSKEVAR